MHTTEPQLNYETELLDLETPIALAIANGDIKAIGEWYHSMICHVMQDTDYYHGNTFIAFSQTKLMRYSLTGQDLSERLNESRWLGRAIADEFGEVPISYLIHAAPIWVNPDDKEETVRPRDNPDREPGAYTLILETEPLCTASSIDEHFHYVNNWDGRVYQTVFKNDNTVDHQFTGQYFANEQYLTERDLVGHPDYVDFTDYCLYEVIIGMSEAFPAISTRKHSEEELLKLGAEIDKEVQKKEQELNQEPTKE